MRGNKLVMKHKILTLVLFIYAGIALIISVWLVTLLGPQVSRVDDIYVQSVEDSKDMIVPNQLYSDITMTSIALVTAVHIAVFATLYAVKLWRRWEVGYLAILVSGMLIATGVAGLLFTPSIKVSLPFGAASLALGVLNLKNELKNSRPTAGE